MNLMWIDDKGRLMDETNYFVRVAPTFWLNHFKITAPFFAPFHLSEIFFHENFDWSKYEAHRDFDLSKSSEIILHFANRLF